MAREIFASLLENPEIQLNWIKEHVGYQGNEKADQLAKEAADSVSLPQFLHLSKSHLKYQLTKHLLKEWQESWDDGTTGRPIHDIVPRVSLHSVGWNREEILFFTRHGPFPAYFSRFKIDLTVAVVRRVPRCIMPQSASLPSPGPLRGTSSSGVTGFTTPRYPSV
ncbi:hypothetical protein AVEN_226420-1 [Araneus ventricosus]|uniref:RNase H type-1 domain-containing protein n=1 Tax=Araneus ventricosus TaxID=182803 RepID=A0A4Y2RHM1_ARAVE|nr:hypothetical protein AVEN_226420-1 [Araneus ventricosus]